MFFLQVITFLASFLLFQIELVVAKLLLPKFGGSYLVWASCVVFFQFVLLLGYLYAHGVIKALGIKKYRFWHLILVVFPLIFFPGRPLPLIVPQGRLALVFDIFGYLAISVGVVFFVLSTISIISQCWLSSSRLSGSSNPYVLYAASNAGSFLALVTYPLLFEAMFDSDVQVNIWRAGYILFVGLSLAAFRFLPVLSQKSSCASSLENNPSKDSGTNLKIDRMKTAWFVLAAASSALFLSATNIITYNIAPCPLLWVIPLSIYLLSFALVFKNKPFCPLWLRENISVVLGIGVLLFFLSQRELLPVLAEIAIHTALLLGICLFCHHCLYENRPKQNDGLTEFYLIIAMGAAAGSMAVTWIAPLISKSSPAEYIASLLLVALGLSLIEGRPFGLGDLRWTIYIILAVILWPLVFTRYNPWGILFMVTFFSVAFFHFRKRYKSLALTLAAVSLILPMVVNSWSVFGGKCIYVLRNYYGIYKLVIKDGRVEMIHGNILHGAQYLDKQRENLPIAYFHHGTPIGRLLRSELFDFKRIAVIGLGGGTLAAYGRPGQEIDFFELDPDVYDMAMIGFTYLQNSSAKVRCLMGDARIMLNTMPAGRYDCIIVDAFSGDSVPTHLITTDALREYKKLLTENGMIMLHISNRYFDMSGVLRANAEYAQARIGFASNAEGRDFFLASWWSVITWDKDTDTLLKSKLGWEDGVKRRSLRPWTDKYSWLASILKWEALTYSLKNLRLGLFPVD